MFWIIHSVLVPSDFHLFPHLKETPAGKKSDSEISGYDMVQGLVADFYDLGVGLPYGHVLLFQLKYNVLHLP